jgi:glutamine amidotransferase
VIAIIDYNIGNLGAIANMLHRLGVSAKITANPTVIESAQSIILPGNGAFDACMLGLRATGLIPLLEQRVIKNQVPLLGICVGAQMLGHGSDEGVETGLGWLDMKVKRLPSLPDLRVPHMGWNMISSKNTHPLTHEMSNDSRFYFVHSYYMEPSSHQNVLMTVDYGIKFAAGVMHNNLMGVQFHPEKSHRFGRKLLNNFAQMHL